MPIIQAFYVRSPSEIYLLSTLAYANLDSRLRGLSGSEVFWLDELLLAVFLGNLMPTVSFDPIQAGAVITRDNYSWSATIGQPAGIITYGFRSTAPSYFPTFVRFSSAEIDATNKVLGLWSDVANISFQQVNAGGFTDSATILLGNISDPQAAWGGMASEPRTKNFTVGSGEGDVWLNLAQHANDALGAAQFSLMNMGSLDFKTLLHEVGHALGLEHPGSYNGTLVQYSTSAEFIEDSWQYTVMSYFGAWFTGANHIYNGQYIYASTPLIEDIAAIQRLYGPNLTTRTGDTVYGFHSNAGEAFAIGSATQQLVFCVWDAGGRDTFDFSGYQGPQIIDLNAGHFSSVGALTQNVSIAIGVTIENAVGGFGNDQIIGNGSANVMTGGLGDDTINGGAGFDTAICSGLRSSYTITTIAPDRYEIVGPDGHDNLIAVDRVQFSDQSVDLTPLGQACTAYSSVLRGIMPDGIANSIEPIVGTTQLPLASYVSQLILQASHSTVPSLIVPQFIEGATPLSGRLDSLTSFSALQYAYYSHMGVSDPSLGPYEALGMGFSQTVQFAQKFSALNDTTFIANNYLDAFGRSAAAGQVAHFQSQIDYFTRLYTGVGIADDVAHVRARGAALGQMLGFAASEIGNDYSDAAKAFLIDASDGTVAYGSSLMNWH